MKKVIVAVMIILLGACLGLGAYTYVQNNRYEHEFNLANSAVKEGNWSAASQHYQAAQSIKMTPKTQTALVQLNHAKKASKAATDDNYHLAQSQYETAMDIDDGLTTINEAIQGKLKQVNQDSRQQQKAEQQAKSEREARSSAIEASKSQSYALKDSLEIAQSKSKSVAESKKNQASKASQSKASENKNEKKHADHSRKVND